jgi:glucose/arabinose dehydrogenase
VSAPAFARKIVGLIVASVCLLAIGPATAQGARMEAAGFQDEPVITGLEEPSNFRFASDGRVFVAEKTGKILVFDGIEDSTPQLFADMRTNVYDTGDRGILGLALDPNFPAKPYVYVLYTYDHILGDPAPPPKWGSAGTSGDPCPELRESDACVVSGRIVRLTAEGDHAAGGALTPLEHPLVEGWCQQFSSHSIGDLQFGPEGALYASGGDGASFSHVDRGQLGDPENPCGDPPNEGGALRAQDVRTPADPTGLNGAVIRIDPESGAGWPGNPLASSADANARRIVAFGLRNPFRFTIDPATHEVYVGNVGWNDFEEIDRFNPAAEDPYNSGWPCYEGPERQLNYESAHLSLCESLYADPSAASFPFFSYRHRQGLTAGDPCLDFRGSAVSGFAFYDEGPFPSSYRGAMFFADSVRGCIYAMFPGSDGRPDPSTVTTFMSHSDPYSGTDLEVGPDGDLYYASLFTEKEGNEFEPGAIHRIEYFSGNQPPVARLSVDHQWGPEHLEATFDAGGSTDADGDPLEYEWDLDGDGVYEDAPTSADSATETFEDDENHTVAVRVVDPDEAASVARVTVYPGDTPPQPTIAGPASTLEWSIGQPISFEGSGEDGEDGELPATSLDWVSRLYHCPQACHAHPLQAFPSVSSGSFLAPEHDLPSHIELTLTAVDSRGLSARSSIELEPRIANLEIVSSPAGVTLGAGLLSQPAPFTLSEIAGTKVLLSAPASADVGGVTYEWRRWSDGGARVHEAVPISSARYEAVYAIPGQEEVPRSDVQPDLTASGAFTPGPGNGAVRPKIEIDKHPRKRSHGPTATFAFSASTAGVRFRCKIDDGHFAPCRSPRSYMHMSLGRHTFKVSAIDASGAPIGKPLAYSWKVVA